MKTRELRSSDRISGCASHQAEPPSPAPRARIPEMQLGRIKAARGLRLDLAFREEERGLPIQRRSGQRPRVFYRRELETQPLVISAGPAR